MKTVLYLLRHGATEANLAEPAILQGQRINPALAPLGVRQAEVTRDFLAIRAFDAVYTSPMQRAVQTASIIAAPHGLKPQVIDALIECDVGRWEGRDWDSIRCQDPETYRSFHANPAQVGYPGGESFADVHARSACKLDDLLDKNPGKTILVVSHHVVTRTYLAGVLGLPPGKARKIVLDNCSISIVTRKKELNQLKVLNGTFHLEGVE